MRSYEKIVYIGVLVFSVLFLIIGNRIAGGIAYNTEFEPTYYTSVVIRIAERGENYDFGFTSSYIIFNARITGGERRGDIITAEQMTNDFFVVTEREVSVGDRVLIAYDDFNSVYFFANYVRINYIAILGALFLVIVILFGRTKGFNAIIALGFTCLAVFWIFIPAILSGRNIFVTAIIICVYSIVSTLLIVIGANKKSLCAILGCLGGVLLACLLMFLMDSVLGLTGVLDQETQSLLLLPLENPLNLRALIFAGVIIGAVGAIMDVAMSISSSLWELSLAGGVSDFNSIFKSGINIGKDILGTMLNTLILAYIGSSLSIILLITVHTNSVTELLNMEMIIVEFLRALIGSLGMLLAIPLTAAVCGRLYALPTEPEYEEEDDDDEYFKRLQARKDARLRQREF